MSVIGNMVDKTVMGVIGAAVFILVGIALEILSFVRESEKANDHRFRF